MSIKDTSTLTRPWGLSPSTVMPGCFASVMATGIVGIGAQIHGFEALSCILFWISVALFAFFLVLTGIRLVRYHEKAQADLRNPAKAFGFFTFIAATNVLATALEGMGQLVASFVLFCIGCAAWAVLGYLIPFATILGTTKRPMLEKVNGTWFIWVVASQSVAVVGAGLAKAVNGTSTTFGADLFTGGATLADLSSIGQLLSLIAVCAWTIGVCLYAAVAVLLGVRSVLYRLGPAEMDAPYWVAMGALAISVVAGSRIVELSETPMLHATQLLVSGTSAALWSFATWLIPALVLIGWWRHVNHRIPLGYSSSLWSMVFPLGMYSVASTTLGQADSIPTVTWIGEKWYWVGLAAWSIVFVAMLVSYGKALRVFRGAGGGATGGDGAGEDAAGGDAAGGGGPGDENVT